MIKIALLIEDNNVTQFLNKHTLESYAFCEKVIGVNSGDDALYYYQKIENGDEPLEHLPEIILLDLNMPMMDGWEFFDAFSIKYPEFIEKTKIFILSSSINPEDEERAKREKNVVAFLTKPLDAKQIAYINGILDKNDVENVSMPDSNKKDNNY